MLPMGVIVATDIFQARLGDLLGDLEHVVVFLDDILVIGNGTFEEHLKQVETVLKRLLDAGMQVNPLKSFWFQEEVDYLGYTINRTGVKPQTKKISKMLAIKEPKNVSELRSFVGLINYYRDMWQGRAHMLAPLTKMCGSKKLFKWDDSAQKAFDSVKKYVAKETSLAHPDFAKPFEVHADSSAYQLGGVISQENRPIAFFSRKLNSAQKNYPITEKELLSIVETLKEYKYLLLGNKIKVFTDHKNLTYTETQHTCDRVLRQRLVLEEYGCEIVYIEGTKNVVADALSRLDYDENSEMKDEINLMRYTYEDNVEVPVDLNVIANAQTKDESLKEEQRKHKSQFETVRMSRGNIEIIMYRPEENKERFLIWIPESHSNKLLSWFHEHLLHPGEARLVETVRKNFYVKGLDNKVRKLVKTCKVCQESKVTAIRPVGKLPLRTVRSTNPFEIVRVDCCGPWAVEVRCKNPPKTITKQVFAVTLIDDATGWPEIEYLEEKSAFYLAKKVDSAWLCRYPQPNSVIFDNGGEFTGREFQELLCSYGIERLPTTVLNPQSNGIKERMHLTMADMLRTMTFEITTEDEKMWRAEVQAALQAVAWAIRTTVSAGTRHAPGHLIFRKDMILNRAVQVNWAAIQKHRETKAIKDNARENKNRKNYEYKINDLCYIVKNKFERKRKLDKPAEGPFKIVATYNNGTVKIDRNGYNEVINIRRLKPTHSA